MSLEPTAVVLTLVMPVDVEDALVETLLEHPDLAPGFTSQPVEGHGQRVSFIGTAEHVRGRAAYCRVQLVVPHADAETLLGRNSRKYMAKNEVYKELRPERRWSRDSAAS